MVQINLVAINSLSLSFALKTMTGAAEELTKALRV